MSGVVDLLGHIVRSALEAGSSEEEVEGHPPVWNELIGHPEWEKQLLATANATAEDRVQCSAPAF